MRRWLWVAALLIVPLLVYWPTVSHEYGFRDDYANMREVRERPGWLMTLTTSNGRPIYGAVLEASLYQVHAVSDLAALRFVAALLIGVVGILLWRQLRRAGWTDGEAAAFAAAAMLLPGAQVVVGWAIAWPIALGLVAAVAGFTLVERGMQARGGARVAYVAAGALLYLASGLTYQTCPLFAVVPLAAVLLRREGSTERGDVQWIAAHLSTLFGSLFAGFVLMNVVFQEGVVPEAARMQIEPHPFIKMLWFFRNPLPNSVALFQLRDSLATPPWFWFVVAGVVVLMLAGFVYGTKSRTERLRWLFAALLLPFAAHSVSLAASSQAIGYRTLLPMSGLFLVLAFFGLRALGARLGLSRPAYAGVLVAVVATAAVLAQRNALKLIAEPQGYEWSLIEAAATRLRLAPGETRVYVIRPSVAHRSTERIYADEYGSLTSDADWAAKEMFKAAMRERFPDGLPAGTSFYLTTGFGPPPPVGYDMIVDLRELKVQGERAPPETTAARR
jgi:hypothetical protein